MSTSLSTCDHPVSLIHFPMFWSDAPADFHASASRVPPAPKRAGLRWCLPLPLPNAEILAKEQVMAP